MLRTVLFLTLFSLVSANLLYASANVNAFIKAQTRIVEGLGEYIQYEEKRLIDLKKSSGYDDDILVTKDRIGNLTKFYEEVKKNYTSRSEEERLKSIDHPISIFHLIKNFVINWKHRLDNKHLYGKKFLDFLNITKRMVPDNHDVTHCKLAILTIQRVFNISSKHILNGNMSGRQVEPLSVADAHDLGILALAEGFPHLAAEWLDLVVKECDKQPNQTTFSVTSAYSKLSLAYHLLGDKDKAEVLIEKAHLFNESDKTVYMLYLQYRNGEVPFVPLHKVPVGWNAFTKLCKANQTVSKLLWYHRCRYKCSRDIFRYYREEILSVAPYVSFIHDVIDNRTANEMKLRAINMITNFTALQTYDLSTVAYLSGGTNTTKHVFSVVANITGLPWKKSGDRKHNIEVVNYGIGGKYKRHLDVQPYLDKDNKKSKRIATIHIFLSDVDVGGATVFTNLGIRVVPRKGSALLLYNYKPDGRPELDLENASCPVIIGQKWIARNYILEYANKEIRPCAVHSNSTHFAVDRILFPLRKCRYP